VVDHRLLAPIPAGWSFTTAASVPVVFLTAYYGLVDLAAIQPGQSLLIHAAAGGVGLILCQWGKALGATVIGCVGTVEKAAIAKKVGAKHTILYREEDLAKRVNEITKGAKCHVVYDGIGKATFPASLDCLRPFGLFASFGSASGAVEAFNISLLAQKGSLFATRPTLTTFMADRARAEKMARDLFGVVSRGEVKIQIGRKWPLAEAAEAHIALEKRETTGSLLLVP
jgi:NADPH2:quinone reductase